MTPQLSRPQLTSLTRFRPTSLPLYLIYLTLFLVAFIPRVLALDAFVAPDEGKWIYRSAHFLQAFLKGDLADMTSVAATPDVEVLAPAVPTMWTGALGLAAKYWFSGEPKPATLLDYLVAIPEETEKISLDFYPWTRFPTVLLTSLAILAFYFLLSKLVTPGTALLAALLLALDPFFIGLSRVIHHDALVSIFILFSLLALLVYRCEAKKIMPTHKYPRAWLVVSGIAGGLALLTKPTALYLVLFAAMFLVLENGLPRRLSDWQRITGEGVIWVLAALGTFVLLWPALWPAPLATLTALLNRSVNAVDDSNNYAFLPAFGAPLPELGFLFYPVNWLFKTTLPVLIGLMALLLGTGRRWFKHQPADDLTVQNSPTLWLIKWLALFCLLCLLLLIPADTRDIRYFLPAALVLQILGAIGIAVLAARLPLVGFMVIGILLLSQLALALIYYPYFVDYLNPVVGGPWLGPKLVKIGSGEGLDQMGRYLEQKPQARRLTVATSFWESFVPFFSGRYTKPHYNEEADYILIYLRQIQNNNPFPEYWTYFSARPPEHKVSLVGLDYAWLYPGPQVRIVREADFGRGIKLRGYRLERPAAQPGQAATLTLIWTGVTPAQASQMVTVRMADPAQQLQVEAHGPLLDPAGPSGVEGHYQLELPAGTPRGDYPLEVSLGDVSHQAGLVPVRQLDRPPAQLPLSANFGDILALGGAEVNQVAEGVYEITLFWQALQPISQSYTTFVHAVDGAGATWGQVDRIPHLAGSELPTNAWQSGEWISDIFQLSLKPDTPPGRYTLLVGWYNGQTLERLPLQGPGEPGTTVELTSITVR